MKKLIIISTITFISFIYNKADAQIRINVGFGLSPRNINYKHAVVAQIPAYEQTTPADNYNEQGYNTDNSDYYYLPDVDAYYDINAQCYFYNDGGNWVSAAYLPGQYHNYNWRDARRFEVRALRPYMHDNLYRERYNGNHSTEAVRDNDNNDLNRGYSNNSYRNDQRFYNWGEQQQHYSQPMQSNRFNNRNSEGGEQFNQPSNNRNTGNSRNDHTQNEHFAQTNARGGANYHNNGRF